ncbi:MAG: flagellar biosynthesis regulator FlaF [Roseovarius sp.]|nr:flagellar biosynthesis regulator FlaF [Roseovarius sp.]
MNATLRAQNAYRSQAETIRSPRSIEYDAFARITHRLTAAGGAGRESMTALASAIHDNRRLWIALAVDVRDVENKLPADLRARILYLAEFTQLHSSKVLNGEADINALVDINTAVMSGLSDRKKMK